MTIEQTPKAVPNLVREGTFSDPSLDVYGPSLEPLTIDEIMGAEGIVCRENYTSVFTRVEGGVRAHTFIFDRDHGQRTNGTEERNFRALRGMALVEAGEERFIVRRGDGFTFKPNQKWNITQIGEDPFEYAGLLPADFNVNGVPGEKVTPDKLPDIEGRPYLGPFNYHK